MIRPGKLIVSLGLIALLYSEAHKLLVGEKINISSAHWCTMNIMKQGSIVILSNFNVLFSAIFI
jgi:hypothetical protein